MENIALVPVDVVSIAFDAPLSLPYLVQVEPICSYPRPAIPPSKAC